MEKSFQCMNCTAIFAKKKFLTIHLKEECGDAGDSVYELRLSQRDHVHGTQYGQSSLSNNSFYMHNCMPSQQHYPDDGVLFAGVAQQQPRQRSGNYDWERINYKIEHDQQMETMVNDREMKPSHGNNNMMLHGPIGGPGQRGATCSIAAFKLAGCLKRTASPPNNMGPSGQYGVKRQSVVFKNDEPPGIYSVGHDEMGSITGMSMPQRQMWGNFSGESQTVGDIQIDQNPFLTKGQSLSMNPFKRNTNFNSEFENNSNYVNINKDLFLPGNGNPLPSPHNSGGFFPNDSNVNRAKSCGFGLPDNGDDFGQQQHRSFIPMNSDDRQIENTIPNSGDSSSNWAYTSRPSLNSQQNYGNPNFNPDNSEENWDDNQDSGVNEGHNNGGNCDESMEHLDSNMQISNLNSIQDSGHQSSSSNMRLARQKHYNTNRSLNRKQGYKSRQFGGNNGGRNMRQNNNGYYGQLSENCQQHFGPQSVSSDALVVVVAHPSIGAACLNVPGPGSGRPALVRGQKAQTQAKVLAVQDQMTVDEPVTTKKTKSEKRILKIARKRGFILGGFKLPYFDNKSQQLPQPEKESYALAFFEEKPIYTINVKNEDDEVTAAVFDDADQKNTKGDSERPSRWMGKTARKQLRIEWTNLHDSKDYKSWKNWWTDFKRYGVEIQKELVKLGCLNLEHCFFPNYVNLNTEEVVHDVIKSVKYALGNKPGMPYDNMKAILILMNTTFLANLKSESDLQAVQDTIRSVPNELWLFKMRSMVFTWVKYNNIIINKKADKKAAVNWMAKQAFKNPCFHWLAMLAFSELETVSELAWSDHEKEFPTI